MNVCYDQAGRNIGLADHALASGGEGAVYEIVGYPRKVVKKYHHRADAKKREDKIREMVKISASSSFSNAKLAQDVAWPLSQVYDQGHNFIGFGIGITIGFSTNSWETLTEWAQRCGEKQIENNGHIIKEQLITASQLAAMPTGTALVMVDSQYKFIAHLPFYDEMYDNSKWKAPQYKPTASGRPFKSLDFEAMVKEIKKKQMESTLSGFSAERKTPAVPTGFPFFEEARPDEPMDIDSLVSRIDAKIAELEAEEGAERKKQGADKKHHVIITEGQSNRARIARVIASATGESLEKAAKRLAQFPVDIAFSTKSEAVKFAKDVTNAGGKATIKTS